MGDSAVLQDLDKRTAAHILHSLAESGQPPKLGARLLNVGTERMLNRLRTDYLETILVPYEGQDGGGTCKWVEADYGNGKTQFQRCMQEEAWDLDYVTAFVELSQDECPLDRADRIYGAVARALQAKPLTPADIDRGRGIERALEQLLDRKFPHVLTGIPDEELKEQAHVWVETSLRSTPVESTAFVTAAVKHLLAKLNGDEPISQLSATYLRGEPLPAAELKRMGVYEKIDKSNGFRMLRSMCQLLQRSELAAGTVLLFDEARRSLSLMSSKSQKIACENLLSVINRCNSGELPGTMFLYAVMPEFFTRFADAYPALQQRCGRSTRIDLNALQGITELDLLVKIGEKISDVFQIAYQPGWDDTVLSSNLTMVAGLALKRTMGTGTRRLLVRTWVQVLQEGRDTGFPPLSGEEVERALDGANDQLDSLDASVVASEGE